MSYLVATNACNLGWDMSYLVATNAKVLETKDKDKCQKSGDKFAQGKRDRATRASRSPIGSGYRPNGSETFVIDAPSGIES